VRFETFEQGAEAARALAQSGLFPSNCRLLDPAEAAMTGAAEGAALLVLGFESADHPLYAWTARALELCADHGGSCPDGPKVSGPGEGSGDGSGGVGAWRAAFLQAPYLRDTMVAAGVLSETFETAITWDRMDEFVGGVRERAEASLREVYGAGSVSVRFTHVYPDGAAPYFTLLAPAKRG